MTEDVCISDGRDYKYWYNLVCENLDDLEAYDDDLKNVVLIFYVSRIIQEGINADLANITPIIVLHSIFILEEMIVYE